MSVTSGKPGLSVLHGGYGMHTSSHLVRPGYDTAERYENEQLWAEKMALFIILRYAEIRLAGPESVNMSEMPSTHEFGKIVVFGYDMTIELQSIVLGRVAALSHILGA